MKLLEDIVAAHKALCEAVLKTAGQSEGAGLSDSAKLRQPEPSKPLQSSSDSPYLSDEEDNQLSQQLALDQTSQFMDRLVVRQFQELHQQRAERAAQAPQTISPLTRPRTIVPEFELSSTPPKEPELKYEPEPVEEVVPEHIRMADFMTKKKLSEPDRPSGRSKPIEPGDIMNDFNLFQSQGG